MQKEFMIKNIKIGSGQPVICVPVVSTTKEMILEDVKKAVDQHIQMIEWRVDFFEQIHEKSAVEEVLQEIKQYTNDTVVLFTFRSKMQGGNLTIVEEEILSLNETAAKSGCVDMIDLEFFEATRPMKEIHRFQDMGVKVIASHHDFEKTPDEKILNMLLQKMQEGGADIVKLAVMPNDVSDVLRLLKVTNDLKVKYSTLPVVTMSMGRLGVISRISGETLGSCITFGANGTASAPGQMDCAELKMVLETLHKVM